MATPMIFEQFSPEKIASLRAVDSARRFRTRLDIRASHNEAANFASTLPETDGVGTEEAAVSSEASALGKTTLNRLASIGQAVYDIVAVEVTEQLFMRRYRGIAPNSNVSRGPTAEAYAAHLVHNHDSYGYLPGMK